MLTTQNKWNTGKLIRGVLILVSACALCCCTNKKKNDLPPLVLKELKSVDDSINKMSPNAERILEAHMKQAKDSMEYYSYHLLYVKYLMLSNRTDSVSSLIEKAIRYGRTTPSSRRQRHILAMALNEKAALLHVVHRNQEEQLKLYNEAYRLLLHPGDTIDLIPDVCANIADTYVQMNDMAQAANWYRRALFLVDSLHLPRHHDVNLKMGLGRVYVNLGDYEYAKKCYEDVDKMQNTLTYGMQAYFINNYGNLFYYMEDYPSALKQFLKLKALLDKLGIKEGYEHSLCKVNLADVYLNMDSLEQSEENIKEPEEFFTSVNDEVGIFYVNTIRIGQAVKRGKLDMVPTILAKENLTTTPETNMQGIRNRYMREYYLARGDYRKAYYILQQEDAATDSIMRNQHNMRTAEIMSRFTEDTLRMHHRIAMSEKDVRMERQTTLIVLLVIVAVLLTAMWLFYVHDQRIKIKNRLLQMRMTIMRNRISPHFVFNVLNNEMATAGDNQQKQLSKLAQLIRENLDLSLQDYIPLSKELEFVSSYIKVMEGSVGKIDFECITAADVIPEETYMPPMMVQILVENAIKHGFKGEEEPHRLRINVEREEKTIKIKVTNNGAPFDIRNNSTGNGLEIIRTTVNSMNQRRPRGASFSVANIDGETVATLQMPEINNDILT